MVDPVGYDGLAAPVGHWGKVDYPDPDNLYVKEYDPVMALGQNLVGIIGVGLVVGLAGWLYGRTHKKV